jgi:predicted  nucleic acid-binding Zn-ribbon protein
MMTIWEKAILNMQRGSKRISISAALFADRVRVEINIVRLRIRIDEVQERIDAQYQAIGRKVDNLTRGDALPKTTEQLVQDEEIAAAMTELTDRKQEIEELRNKIMDEQASAKTARREAEGTSE